MSQLKAGQPVQVGSCCASPRPARRGCACQPPQQMDRMDLGMSEATENHSDVTGISERVNKQLNTP